MSSILTYSQEDSTAPSVPLIEILKHLEERYDANFSFNHSLLNNLTLPQINKDNTLKNILADIESLVPVSFKVIGENEFLIIPVRSDLELEVKDVESRQDLPIIFIQVNDQQKKYLLPRDGVKFLISELFVTDSILIQSKFHESTKLAVSDLLSNDNKVNLTPHTIELDEVAIVGYMTSGIDAKLSDHSIEVDMKDLSLLAGETDGDILQLLKAVPGINTPDGKSGSLNIRGSTFSQNLIYFDNIPIYHKGHFFGTVSPFNSGVVDKVTIQRGVLPAQWGGRVGGLIDIKTSNDIPEKAGGGILANTVYAAARFNTPIIKDKLGVYISARSNYPFSNLSPKLQAFSELNFQGSKLAPSIVQSDSRLEQFDIGFNDLNGKLIYDMNEDNRASFSFIKITNDFAYIFNSDNRNLEEVQSSDLDNWGVTGSWNSNLSEKTNIEMSLTTSSVKIYETNTELENGALRKFDEVTNSIDDIRLVSRFNHKINNQNEVSFGYEFTNQQLTFEEDKNDGPPSKDINTSAKVNTIYGNLQKNIGERWITNWGVHTDYYAPLKQLNIDPRFSLSYLATNNLSIKSSGGRSHQYIKQNLKSDFDDFRVDNQFWHVANDSLPVLEGWQGMFGAAYEKSNWILDLEVYAKNTNGITQFRTLGPGQSRIGEMSTIGADFFVKRRWQSIESWVSYSISESISDFDQKRLTYFDQTHIMSLMLLLDLKRWDVALSWNYMSGMPVILPDLSAENNQNPDAPTSLDIPYTDRFPAQHQLDLSVTYQIWPAEHKLKGVIGLSMLNLYDNENIINLFQANISADNLYRKAIGFSPNLQLSISF
jgi:hypothetical protein